MPIWEPRRKLIAHQCCGQLTAVKTGYPLTSITWPYRGLRCRPVEVKYFLKLSPDKLLVFKWSQAQVCFFKKFIWNMSCLCHYGPALLRFWFQKFGHKNSASYLKTQAEDTFFIMDTRWSRSTSNLYALIGQNLTGEFTRKIYAVSWNLFTLTAQAGRVLCQLVMFFTVVSHWMHKMKYSC